MKLNKSILSLVFLVVFALSSCTQARYGSRTRRVKGNTVAQQHKKTLKVERNAGVIVAKEEPIAKTIDKEKIKELVALEVVAEMPEVVIETSSNKTEVVDTKAKNTATARAEHKKPLQKIKDLKLAKRAFNQIKQEVKTSVNKPASGGDVDSLIYILIVVLLVLLILSLLFKLGGVIQSLLSLALLIFLIWLVIQLLG